MKNFAAQNITKLKPKGFLETATVFSATQETRENWNLSLPVYAEDFENSKTKVSNNSR